MKTPYRLDIYLLADTGCPAHVACQKCLLRRYYSDRARAGLKSALGSLAKPLKAAEVPPGSRFSDFVAWPVTASARHGHAA